MSAAVISTSPASVNEMLLAARAAGLRYVDTNDPGISRRRRGTGFFYVDPHGRRVTDRETLERIASLVIPPAWEEVWISPSPRGHIQATGRDARGRRQYRYHPQWQQSRDETKYERTIAFARALPRLRRQVDRDLRRRGIPREKVLAAAVRLLETTLIRVGNEEYARTNRSYGLTTLRDRHARITKSGLKLSFRGKAGKMHVVGLRDRRLARVVRACQELPGQRLFQYVDDTGEPRTIDSDDVNEYIRTAMGDDFSAKDFRTWAGTVLAARALQEVDEVTEQEATDGASAGAGAAAGRSSGSQPTKAALARAVKRVAADLGNTAAVCRRCYIHPAIIDAYLDGSLAGVVKRQATEMLERGGALSSDERHVLRLLRSRVAGERRRGAIGTRTVARAA